MTISIPVEDLAVWIPATAVVVAALGYLITKLRTAFKRLEAIDQITARELERNHGSSMADDVHGIAVAQGKTQRDLDDLQRDVNTLSKELRDHLRKGDRP